MVDLNRIVATLQATRDELTQQRDAIDKAIAALTTAVARSETPQPLAPTRLKPKRVLGDAHKEALAKGRRRAREVREAAAGRAREMPDDSFVPALGPGGGAQPPRLIKKPQGLA